MRPLSPTTKQSDGQSPWYRFFTRIFDATENWHSQSIEKILPPDSPEIKRTGRILEVKEERHVR